MDSLSEVEEEVELLEEDKLLIMQLVVNAHFGDGNMDTTTLRSYENKGSRLKKTGNKKTHFSKKIREMVIQNLALEFFHLKNSGVDNDEDVEKIVPPTPEDDIELLAMISKVTGDSTYLDREGELREILNNQSASIGAERTKSTEESLTSISEAIGQQTNEKPEDIDFCNLPTRPNSRASSPNPEEPTVDRYINEVDTPEIEVVQECEREIKSVPAKNDSEEVQYDEDIENAQHSTSTRTTLDSVDSSKNKHQNPMEVEWETTEDEQCTKSVTCADDVVNGSAGRRRKHVSKHVDTQKTVLPMDDKKGTFFLDREVVLVHTYQDGLKNSRWNPTQVLYEICSQSQWAQPQFILIDYVVGEGFLFAVEVKGHKFLPKERCQTKKSAKHHASAYFLRFLGFDFTYEESKPPSVAVFNQPNIRSVYNKPEDRRDHYRHSPYINDKIRSSYNKPEDRRDHYRHSPHINDTEKYRHSSVRHNIPKENYPEPRREKRPHMMYDIHERKVPRTQDKTCNKESMTATKHRTSCSCKSLLKIREYETSKCKGKRKRDASNSSTCETNSVKEEMVRRQIQEILKCYYN